MKILIVDDQPDNIFLVQRMLEKADFKELYTASSVKAAFNFLGFYGEPAQAPIDLILMDVMMPEIDGIEGCRQLKKHEGLREIPIIMLTALTDSQHLQQAFEAGAVDYVTKPLRSVELLARLRSALRLKTEMDARKRNEEELRKRNKELEKALSEIKTLQGFLPICSYCKKIRDVKGYWQQLEAYMSQHADVVFSHSICDPCMQTHYPDYVRKDKKGPDHEAA
jgi:sigma-B regulation protein RsbU (phosphoserine phosphatase)